MLPIESPKLFPICKYKIVHMLRVCTWCDVQGSLQDVGKRCGLEVLIVDHDDRLKKKIPNSLFAILFAMKNICGDK